MDVNTLSQLGATNAATTKASTGLANNFDTFLLLLTTQLKNQDPLSPIEATEFTSQLVQFASVEQQIAGNKNLEKLIALQQTSQVASAVSFIGTDVEVTSDKVALAAGGTAGFSYTLSKKADSVAVSILNEQGTLVRAIIGDPSTGKHEMVWDGLDGNGTAAPEGAYTVRITALDAEGNPITSIITVLGRVTGVNLTDGAIRLRMGDVEFPIEKVLTVSQPASAGQPGA